MLPAAIKRTKNNCASLVHIQCNAIGTGYRSLLGRRGWAVKIMYGSHSTTYMQLLLRRLTSMDESHKAQSMGVDVSGLPFRKEIFTCISSLIKQNHADYTSLLWKQESRHGHCATLKERQVKDKARHLKTQGLSINTANDNPSLVMSNSVMWAIRWEA